MEKIKKTQIKQFFWVTLFKLVNTISTSCKNTQFQWLNVKTQVRNSQLDIGNKKKKTRVFSTLHSVGLWRTLAVRSMNSADM